MSTQVFHPDHRLDGQFNMNTDLEHRMVLVNNFHMLMNELNDKYYDKGPTSLINFFMPRQCRHIYPDQTLAYDEHDQKLQTALKTISDFLTMYLDSITHSIHMNIEQQMSNMYTRLNTKILLHRILSLAARYNYYILVKLLCSAPGIDINLKNPIGTTALIEATDNGHTKIVQILLDHGAMVDIKTHNGWTALMYAADGGNAKIIQLLLTHNATVDTKNYNGCTALMYAANNGHTKIVQILLAHGAKVDIKDHDDWTALMYGVSGPVEITQTLLAHGATIYTNSWGGWTAPTLAAARDDYKTLRCLQNHMKNNASNSSDLCCIN